MTPEQIISESNAKYKPVMTILMVSGGHDSITNAHVSASILTAQRRKFRVYHGDTGTGIPQTQEYVRAICQKYGWDLDIRKPPTEKDTYEYQVLKWGFPGPTRQSHRIMYRHLKERALRKYVTHDCKSAPRLRENVLLLTGLRQSESNVRMGYTLEQRKVGSQVWANPIFYFSEEQCNRYMEVNNIPRNPVKDKICISGECLCGAFAGKEEWAEIKFHYPEVAERIEALHQKAIEKGFPWSWASGPTEWRKSQAVKNQLNMFMCVGCETRKDFKG